MMPLLLLSCGHQRGGVFAHPERSALEEAPEEIIRAILAARSQEGH